MNRIVLSNASKLLFRTNSSSVRAISTTTVKQGHFAKDFKPGQYPESEAERVAAAKKYGMLPQDYEPMANDGLGFGDYPNVKPITADSRDPWEDYDDDFNRRNFGEPVNFNENMK